MLPPNHKPIQPSRRQALQAAAAALLPLGSGANETATPFAGAECIAPSKPGGGFDLTCAVASQAIAKVRPHATPLHTRYLPGGIGAVAFDRAASGRLGGPGTLVAFSSGSLLNIAQGRFGPHPVQAVRWIATLGTDYGVVAVHRDSPHQTLPQLVRALREDTGAAVGHATSDAETGAYTIPTAHPGEHTVVAYPVTGENLPALVHHGVIPI